MNVNLDAKKYILLSLGVLCAMMFAIPRLSADNGNSIAIRWWGRDSISIETQWNLTVAINPWGDNTSADLFLFTQAHPVDTAQLSKNSFLFDFSTDASSPQLLDRLANQDATSWSKLTPLIKPSGNAIRVTSLADQGKIIQMPPDYVAAHADWTGKEEARQMERVSRFTRRFSYLLKDLPMDKKAPGSFWTPKSLLRQMDDHYSEHTANVVKKFELPDWPKNNAPTVLSVWPDLAPGETSRETGTLLPVKSGETKPIDRVSDVRRPTLDVYPAKNNPSGTAVIILPGGGFTYVVPNLEGSEAAEWLNDIGITAFVLRYRTKESAQPGEPLWQRPLQDMQRAMRVIRHESQRWQLQTDRIGILAFSAGGQVGAIAHSKANQSTYTALDAIDEKACNPDFSILIYPWQLLDVKTGELLDPIQITEQSTPAFIVHTHDDASSSVGAAKLYIALKQHKVPAELHVYQNGGHGYGVRDRPNSVISSWPARATDWLKIRGLLDQKN